MVSGFGSAGKRGRCARSLPRTPHLTSPLEGGRDEIVTERRLELLTLTSPLERGRDEIRPRCCAQARILTSPFPGGRDEIVTERSLELLTLTSPLERGRDEMGRLMNWGRGRVLSRLVGSRLGA